jgi:hypothetical protein
LQAIGLRHRVLWVRLGQIPRRRRDQASIPQDNESRFQRSEWSLAEKPRALPWAGMNDAVGVPNRPAVPPGLFSWCLSRPMPLLTELAKGSVSRHLPTNSAEEANERCLSHPINPIAPITSHQ